MRYVTYYISIDVDLLVLCYDASSKKKSRKECMKHWKKDMMKVSLPGAIQRSKMKIYIQFL